MRLSTLRRLPVVIGYRHGPRLMSWLRKRWVLLRHPQATIRFGRDTYLGPGFSLHIPGEGTFVTGERCEFRRDFRCEVHGDGSVIVGDGCHFTYGVVIQCSTTIEIGDRCIFAQGTFIVDGSHRFRDLSVPMLEQGYDYRPLRIADDVATMAKSTVIADIGTRAFVGANAVVTRPVPPYTVAVGVPAKPIEYFGPPGLEPPGLVAQDRAQ